MRGRYFAPLAALAPSAPCPAMGCGEGGWFRDARQRRGRAGPPPRAWPGRVEREHRQRHAFTIAMNLSPAIAWTNESTSPANAASSSVRGSGAAKRPGSLREPRPGPPAPPQRLRPLTGRRYSRPAGRPPRARRGSRVSRGEGVRARHREELRHRGGAEVRQREGARDRHGPPPSKVRDASSVPPSSCHVSAADLPEGEVKVGSSPRKPRRCEGSPRRRRRAVATLHERAHVVDHRGLVPFAQIRPPPGRRVLAQGLVSYVIDVNDQCGGWLPSEPGRPPAR